MRCNTFQWLCIALAAVLNCVIATPITKYVVHEKREPSPSSQGHVWERKTRVHPDAIVPLRIGLAQSNLEAGYEHLISVSHPSSPRYGQYYSAEEVHSLFAPAEDAVAEVRSWLTGVGIDDDDIVLSDSKGWLALNVPAAVVERLFDTTLHEYEHSSAETLRLGCEKYHLPSHLTEYVDYITPGVKLSAPVIRRDASSPRSASQRRRLRSSIDERSTAPALDSREATSLPPDLRHCGVNITTACIRALYGIPVATIQDQDNAPGFFEQGDYYSQQDLNIFFKELAPWIPSGTEPVRALIDGAKDPVPPHGKLSGSEANVDLEVAFSLIYPTIPTVYQVDDQYYEVHEIKKNNLFNTFLDALDGSYCNYTAYGITGDSWEDPKYPDPRPHGYKGSLQCGVYKPTRVISISYGEAEADIPLRYDKRQCNEFMKLALQGHTVLEASGDYGVASFPGDDNPDGCLQAKGSTGKAKVFNPDQLSGCPYITSVGGTMLQADQTAGDMESAMQVPLRGAALFASHGGFSNYFPRPAYQEEAVKTWFEEHNPGLPSYVANADASNVGEGGGVYNRAGRAFPDVSANGVNILGVAHSEVGHQYGTSFSAPIWASVITLINQQRTLAGKGPVGFINPTLYAHPWALNDITNGSNPNCGGPGFSAVKGWDPVTGLGTPNFPKLLEVFMALP